MLSSAPSVEPHVAAGMPEHSVRRVVGSMVVEAAEKHAIVEISTSAEGPGSEVMCVAPGCGDGAPLRATSPVAQPHRLALRRVEQPAGATEVEDLGLAAQHRRDDCGVAGESASLAGSDP